MCGVFGIYAPDRDVARLTYFALYALQHRGQESAGIAIGDGRRITAQKELGLVPQVFDETSLEALSGGLSAIGHTRYSTTGSSRWPNTQPVMRHRQGRTVALGHNGNLTNTAELRTELAERGVRLETTSDTEVIAALICEHPGSLAEAVRDAMGRIHGAFSAVVTDGAQVIAFRDPDGIRPLVLGDLDGAPVIASETCALDIVGATFVCDIQPGQLVILDELGARIAQAQPARQGGGAALCIFEFIYFARPDSRMDGIGLHASRVRMGEHLAGEAPVDADIVISVPDSGTPAAQGYARASGIPFADGLVKNRYVHRTFIQPEQGLRENGIKLKFNPIPDNIAGQRVVVVDDSIVRGSTTRKIVKMLFEAGAAEVHLRISSPPIVSPCYYGIDMAGSDELIAAQGSVEDTRESLGATSLAYLSLDGLQSATTLPSNRFCRACLTKSYPTTIPAELREGGRLPLRGRTRRMTEHTYAAAGVSLDAAEAIVGRLAAAVRSTRRPGVVESHGGFAGLFDLGDRLLVSGTDGVGTKLVLHARCGTPARRRRRLRRDVRERRALHGRQAAVLPRLHRGRPHRSRSASRRWSRASPTAVARPAPRCWAARPPSTRA